KDSYSHPPPLPSGAHRFAPDPIYRFNKIQKARISQVFYFHSPIVSVKLETNVNYLIHNCEQKSYYFSSHTYRKGFSREKTDSQCQHANHRKLHSCTSLPHRARGRAAH